MANERMEMMEDRLDRLEEKVDKIMEQVQLGRHLLLFAKAIGWAIGIAAAAMEAYGYWKGAQK